MVGLGYRDHNQGLGGIYNTFSIRKKPMVQKKTSHSTNAPTSTRLESTVQNKKQVTQPNRRKRTLKTSGKSKNTKRIKKDNKKKKKTVNKSAKSRALPDRF